MLPTKKYQISIKATCSSLPLVSFSGIDSVLSCKWFFTLEQAIQIFCRSLSFEKYFKILCFRTHWNVLFLSTYCELGQQTYDNSSWKVLRNLILEKAFWTHKQNSLDVLNCSTNTLVLFWFLRYHQSCQNFRSYTESNWTQNQ